MLRFGAGNRVVGLQERCSHHHDPSTEMKHSGGVDCYGRGRSAGVRGRRREGGNQSPAQFIETLPGPEKVLFAEGD